MADTPNKSAAAPIEGFRDPLLQINFNTAEQKQDKEFGRTILSRIWKEQNNQSSTFFYGGRNIRWKEVSDWGYGRQSMQEFIDYTKIDGNNAYNNIDMTPTRVGPQFLETLVSFVSSNEEYVSITAIDDQSKSQKEKDKQDAMFRMHEVGTIDSLQQRAGIHIEAPNAYVPDDELSASVYFELEHKLPVEIDFEKRVERVKTDNEYDMNKRRVNRDLILFNCGVTKIEKLDNGFTGIRKCVPSQMIYNFFMSDSGKMELSYIGEKDFLKIVDIRKKYGKTDERPRGLTEQEIFEMAKYATQYNTSSQFVYWNDTYLYATDRPYDDYSVLVFDCEVRSFDADYFVSKTDNYGKENIQPKKGIPKPTSDKASIIKKNKMRWQRGIWAIGADKMIYWGDPDIKIIPPQDISSSLSSYTINVPNNDGNYVPSLFERGLDKLRTYTLADKQRNKVLGAVIPPGYTIDVEGIRDIDLGMGKTIGPEEVVNIYSQTGKLWWSSRGVNPNEKNVPPITGLPNAEGIAQLNELTMIMTACKSDLRELLGVSIFMDGSYVAPRTPTGMQENQAANTTNVIGFIPSGAKQLWEETFYKCCILEWDKAVLGKENRNDLMNTAFRVDVEIKQTAEEKIKLDQLITTGMQEQLLTFKDAFFIRQIKNYKLANWYLGSTIDKNKKEAAAQQQQAVQQNAQAQQASNQQAAQQAAQLEQLKQQGTDAHNRDQKELALLTILGNMQDAAIAKGTEVPDVWKPVMAAMISNVVMPVLNENIQMRQAMAMQQQQAAQQQQPQGQPQQGQPQPQNTQQ